MVIKHQKKGLIGITCFGFSIEKPIANFRYFSLSHRSLVGNENASSSEPETVSEKVAQRMEPTVTKEPTEVLRTVMEFLVHRQGTLKKQLSDPDRIRSFNEQRITDARPFYEKTRQIESETRLIEANTNLDPETVSRNKALFDKYLEKSREYQAYLREFLPPSSSGPVDVGEKKALECSEKNLEHSKANLEYNENRFSLLLNDKNLSLENKEKLEAAKTELCNMSHLRVQSEANIVERGRDRAELNDIENSRSNLAEAISLSSEKSSLLDDFADTSTEPVDYMGGDD